MNTVENEVYIFFKKIKDLKGDGLFGVGIVWY